MTDRPLSGSEFGLGGFDIKDTFTYAGLTLTLLEVQALFRFEIQRRARVAKEMRRVRNVVANRGGKKDPVFKQSMKTKGPRKTNPKEINPDEFHPLDFNR